MTIPETPMLRQYYELKRQHPGTLLFFRLGDFYELFFEDAVTGARELEITLTARNKEKGNPVPMCGVPYHAASGYIAKLIRKGFRVAVCEQTEDATKGKKLVNREVVRVITPGTAIDPQLIAPKESTYLAAVCGGGDLMAAAFLDLSTGEFRVTQTSGRDSWQKIQADLASYSPREILFPSSLSPLINQLRRQSEPALPLRGADTSEAANVADLSANSPDRSFAADENTFTLSPLDDWLWGLEDASALLMRHLNVSTLAGYELTGKSEAIKAAGACLRYVHDTQRAAASHITDISFFEPQDCLLLDPVTTRNLELTESLSTGRRTSLLEVIDETCTGMGARLLRSWLLRPPVRRGEIEARHGAVRELVDSHLKRDSLRVALKDVSDLERLIARLNMNSASPRDLGALRASVEKLPAIRDLLSSSGSALLQVLFESVDELSDVRETISSTISDDPPARVSDGEVIKAGHSAELDELRSISRNAKQTIASLEARERERSGIQSLRIRFNNVFGYYIEVSKANSARVPPDYERRQTLANAERYTTPELKEWETRVLGAEDRIVQLENELFAALCANISAQTKRIQQTARAVASLDALSSLAETAVRRRYVQPTMHDGDTIEIVQGRHPVIEAFNDGPFVPNDLYMNNSTDRLLIITGPNMGGKSTVLRQTAIICLLAQMGSFVPANRARLPILDRVWTRVGASDDLARGRSTFMVEMTETAAILRNATPRSLVLLDEVGRGTSTFDGLSIAWAVAEYLHDSPEHAAKTLFATHYHELTDLAEKLPGAQNYQITASERDGDVVFLHKLERGRASKSYGIEVARLAGLPPPVLERAREVLSRLEKYELDVFGDAAILPEQTGIFSNGDHLLAESDAALAGAAKRAARKRAAAQVSLFDFVNQHVLDELRTIKVETLSPEEARGLLSSLQERLV
jgi:DNA mismatch repair protein MutS